MKKKNYNCLGVLFSLLLFIFTFSSQNTVYAQLAGNYTINPNLPASSTNYLTFTSAVSDLVSGTRSDGGSKNGPGVKAAVVFNVADGTYEEQLYFYRISGTSATNTVTFQSASKNSSNVVLSKVKQFVDKPMLTLDSVEYLIFKQLSFIRSYGLSFDGNSPVVILKRNANNNYFLNNYLAFDEYIGNADVLFQPIIHSSSSFCIFKNNYLKFGEFGINLIKNSNQYSTGNIIEGNIIDSSLIAIQGNYATNLSIFGNRIIGSTEAILLKSSSGNIIINKNYISASGLGLEINSSLNGNMNLLCTNNMILSRRAISYWAIGNAKFINNNIFSQGGLSGVQLYMFQDSINNQKQSVNFINNNIFNSEFGNAIFISGFQNISFNSDYNNIYSTDSFLAIINGTKIKNLYAFRQITKTDSSSISVNPAYVSATDLHVRNPALDGKGKPLAEVTDDFDGELRDPNFPDIGADEFTPVFAATDSVWPGDANYDRIANVYDVLNIGVAYNTTGTPRTNASTNWTAQAAADWSKSFSNALNYKHADCNGDGKVDINDLQPILLNYGKTHNKTGLNKTGTPNDPALYVQFPNDSFLAGDTVTANLYLGTNNISVSNGYGFAFSLNYNPKYIDSGSFTIDFSNSWFGKKDTDIIYLVHDDYNNGQMDIGITRINQKNVSGYGKIGTCSFVLQENIAAKRWIEKTITLEPSDVIMISADETEIPIFTIADSIKAQQFVGINKTEHNAEKEIRIYPNPVKDILTIDAAGQKIKEVKIMNMLGQVLYVKQNQASQENITIPTAELPKGIYNVIITTEKGISGRRIARQ